MNDQLTRLANVAALAINSGVSGGRLDKYIDRLITEWSKQ